jgi:oxygen-independent coproporphyrinogen-3 oxidase
MQVLLIQLNFELKKMKEPYFKSIFFGGGTPSSIDSSEYNKVFSLLKPFINKKTEITFEANPNSASFDWLQSIKQLGATRISFGVQSFNDEKLKFLGRNHSKQQAIDAISNANKAGFSHINMDIIYDTALDTKDLLKEDLELIKQLPIDHISAYSLTIEEGTKFFKKPQTKIENIALANYFFSTLSGFGFSQYEISNFAKSQSSQSIHNYGYWEKEDYFGVGAGAVGTFKNKRYYPHKDLNMYIQNPTQYELIEDISKEDYLFETIFLGFRSDVGVSIDLFTKKQKEKIDILINEKKLIVKETKVYNPNFLLTDEIVLFID